METHSYCTRKLGEILVFYVLNVCKFPGEYVIWTRFLRMTYPSAQSEARKLSNKQAATRMYFRKIILQISRKVVP